MKKNGRYDVSGLPEAQFEPGSNEQVLKNLLGIKSPKEMDDTEARALEGAMAGLLGKYDERHRFTAADVCEIHKSWLGGIYEWAGKYRQVNVGKGDFPFAAARWFRPLWRSSKGTCWRGIHRAISKGGQTSSAPWRKHTWNSC